MMFLPLFGGGMRLALLLPVSLGHHERDKDQGEDRKNDCQDDEGGGHGYLRDKPWMFCSVRSTNRKIT